MTVDRDYRTPVNYALAASLIGTKTSTIGSLVVGRINKSLSIMAKSSDVRIKFGNIGPYPYSVLSYGWTGDAKQVGY